MSTARVVLSVFFSACAAGLVGFAAGRLDRAAPALPPSPAGQADAGRNWDVASPVSPTHHGCQGEVLLPDGTWFTPEPATPASVEPGPEDWIGWKGHSWRPEGRWVELDEVLGARSYDPPKILLPDGGVIAPARSQGFKPDYEVFVPPALARDADR